jgi:hypothetical protein
MTTKAIRNALKNFRKESEVSNDDKKSKALDLAYAQTMERIEGQEAGFQELAIQVLSWITCAKRPLSTLELRLALAVEIGHYELDQENLPETEDMVSVCAGLVTIDKESDVIRLVHYTTQEYFERTQTSWFPNAQNVITRTCVTYISFDTFESGFCPTDKEFKERLRLNPFYDYAARNWGHHARATSTQTGQLILDFLSSEAKVAGSSQAMMASISNYRGNYSQRVPRQITGAHFAAYFGLSETTIALLKNGHNPDVKDTFGRTPLSWSAENGHEAVVKLLLDKEGVDPDSKDTLYGQTPLGWAAANGHEAVVKLLLDREDVNPDFKDAIHDETPLRQATANGHVAVVRLLLNKQGIDLDSKDAAYARTPLCQAAASRREAVIKLLQRRGVLSL